MRPEQLTGKKILYGCLDWGNGHVARSVPLIRQLLGQGNEITLWCSEKQRTVFESFGLNIAYHTGFETDFTFTGDGNFRKELLRNALRFLRAISSERKAAEVFAKSQGIDLIISDHRYGLRSTEIASVFVTHQVKLPPGSGIGAQAIHHHWMSRFETTWIMDAGHTRLAGELSEPAANSSYIGHYSRFAGLPEIPLEPKSVVVIISGPEPYAENFYRLTVDLARQTSGNWKFVCSADYRNIQHDFPVINNWRLADEAIRSAEYIVSRNGYSTLMDLQFLGKKAVLVPTPGQSEQQYLAEKHAGHLLWKIAKNEEEFAGLLLELLR